MPTVARIPDADDVVVPGGHQPGFAVRGGEGDHAGHRAGRSLQGPADLSAHVGIPDADGAVVADGGQPGVAVTGGEGAQGPDRSGVPRQRPTNLSAPDRIPEPDAAVAAGRGQPDVPERCGPGQDVVDACGVSVQGIADELSRIEIPESQGFLFRDSEHLVALLGGEPGAARLRPELAGTGVQRPDPLARVGLPDLEDVVVGVSDGTDPRRTVASREPGDHLHLVQLFDESRRRARLGGRIPDPDGVVAGGGSQQWTPGGTVEGKDIRHLGIVAAQRHPDLLAGRAIRDLDVVPVRGSQQGPTVGVGERGLTSGGDARQWRVDGLAGLLAGTGIPHACGGVLALGDEQGTAIPGVAAGEFEDIAGVSRERQVRSLGASDGLPDEPCGFVDGARRHGREPGGGELPDALPVLRVRVAQQMAGGQHPRDPGRQRVSPEGVLHDSLGQFTRANAVHGELVLGQFLQPRLHARAGGKRRFLLMSDVCVHGEMGR